MVLVTGASGVIGSCLVRRMLKRGASPVIAGRDPDSLRRRWPSLEARLLDVMREETLGEALEGVTAAFYLIHSMEPGEGDFAARDADSARAFARAASRAGIERVIYLGGLGDDRGPLSAHLRSRQETGRALADEGPLVIEFRAAMVVSSDSASFRMLMDLVRRLPAMIVPRWVETPSQPIAVDDVLDYLVAALEVEAPEHHTVIEVGGQDVVTYRQMIEIAASRTGRAPLIVGVPLLTPRLSSYWAALTTSVPASVAMPLIEGLATPLLVRTDAAQRIFPTVQPMPFKDALSRAPSRDPAPGVTCTRVRIGRRDARFRREADGRGHGEEPW